MVTKSERQGGQHGRPGLGGRAARILAKTGADSLATIMLVVLRAALGAARVRQLDG